MLTELPNGSWIDLKTVKRVQLVKGFTLIGKEYKPHIMVENETCWFPTDEEAAAYAKEIAEKCNAAQLVAQFQK